MPWMRADSAWLSPNPLPACQTPVRPTRRAPARPGFRHGRRGVPRAPHFFNQPDHFLRRFLVGTTDHVRFNVPGLHPVRVHDGNEALDLLDISQDFDAVTFAQNFPGDCAGGDPADGFAPAAPPAPPP